MGGGLIFRWFVFLAAFVTVTAAAQEAPVTDEPDTAQARQETAEQQAEEKAADVAPEFFDPTEETPEDSPADFPVDI